MKFLFASAASLAVLTVSCTSLMPVAQSKLGYGKHLASRNPVVSAFSGPVLDPGVQSALRDLQASALLNCIGADATAPGPAEGRARVDLTDASRYEALYAQLHAQPDLQRALALMQAAEMACGNGAAQRIAHLQRAAFALDRQIDVARGEPSSLVDDDGVVVR